jgi:hypothetical protein
MSFLISAALFLAGMYLAIRVLAALHRIIDLWYTMRTAWPKVVRALLVWCGGTVALALILPAHYRAALLWGLATYLAFYLGVFALWHLVVPRLTSRRAAD